MQQGLGWIDTAFLAVMAVSAAVGLWRGVVYELMSLAGWLVAWVVANTWGGQVAVDWLPAQWPPVAQRTAGFALLFVAALVIWRVLVWLLQQLVQASPVAPVDRLLGAAFGMVRGVVIVLALVLLVGWTPLGRSADWTASAAVQWARWGLQWVAPWVDSSGIVDRIRLPVQSSSGLPIVVPDTTGGLSPSLPA